ncbi:MAG: spore cortex biosynthesis protein YabQ [Candidatus Limiplasma sp.]|nr:spore cortex biosynthesis protein YabQ [Candidatus Limiplasma sp.]
MTTFFETEFQGLGFLFLCAVGFGLAVVFDGISALFKGSLRPVGDILLFLCCGVALLLALFFLRAGELRLYHWLALLTGALLYLCGIRRLVSLLALRVRNGLSQRKKRKENS